MLFRDGDHRAFDEIVNRYSDRIFSFTKRFLVDEALAEDATQETFIKIWKHKKSFDDNRSFTPWIFQIARNTALDMLRKRKDFSFSQMSAVDDSRFEEGIEDETISLADDFDTSVLHTALEKTLEVLSPDQRSVVLLHDVEGLTFEEIGETMAKPMNTVKSHYRRAILALRKRLTENGFV